MTKLITTIIFILVFSTIYAQQYLPHSQIIRTTNKDSITDMLVTPTGNILLLGIKERSGQTDAYLCNFNPDGTINWCNIYGTTSDDYAYSIALAPDGNFLVVGQTFVTDVDSGDAFIFKVDTQGTVLWQRVLRSPFREAFYDVEFLVSQGVIAAVGFTSEVVFCEITNDIMVNFFNNGNFEKATIPYAASCNYEHKTIRIKECKDYILAYSQIYIPQYNIHSINLLQFNKSDFSFFATTLPTFPSPYKNVRVMDATCNIAFNNVAVSGFMDYSPGVTPIKKVAFFNVQLNRYHLIVGDSTTVITTIDIDTSQNMMYVGGYVVLNTDTVPFIAKRNITTNAYGIIDTTMEVFLITDSNDNPINKAFVSSLLYSNGSLIVGGNISNPMFSTSFDNFLSIYDS